MPNEDREDRGDEQSFGREPDTEQVPVDRPPDDAGDRHQLYTLRLSRRSELAGELPPARERCSERASDPDDRDSEDEGEGLGGFQSKESRVTSGRLAATGGAAVGTSRRIRRRPHEPRTLELRVGLQPRVMQTAEWLLLGEPVGHIPVCVEELQPGRTERVDHELRSHLPRRVVEREPRIALVLPYEHAPDFSNAVRPP